MKVMASGMFAVLLVSCWERTQKKPEAIPEDSVSRGRGEKRDTASCSPDKNAEKDRDVPMPPVEAATDNGKELYRKYNKD